MNPCIDVHATWSFYACQASFILTGTTSISHAGRIACWWYSRTSFNIKAFRADCLEWAHETITDYQGVGTPATKGTYSPFIKPMFLSLFIQMRFHFCDFLSSMPNLCYVLGGLGADNRGQIRVRKLLRIIDGSGRRTQERMTNVRQEAGNSSKISRQTASVRHLREHLHESDARHHRIRVQLCFMQDKLHHEESEFSARAVKYYCMTNKRHRILFETSYERYERFTKKACPSLLWWVPLWKASKCRGRLSRPYFVVS